MFEFLSRGLDPTNALPQSFSPILVVTSYLIAALASYAGLLMSVCIANTEGRVARVAWLAGGSVAMGIGVWAMHFTGMLALSLPVPVTYDAPITALSVLPAIIASALALYVMAARGDHHRRYLIGGMLVGVGIGAMHYIGMAAMRVEFCTHPYDPGLFLLSIVVAVLLGIAAFYSHDLWLSLGDRKRERTHIVFSAGLMGLAITGMHYTAMAAVSFVPGANTQAANYGVNTFWLSISVSAISMAIILLAIVATIVARAFQQVLYTARIDKERIIEAIDSLNDGFTLYDDQGSLTMCNRVLHNMYPALASLLRPGTHYKDLVSAWTQMRGEAPPDRSGRVGSTEGASDYRVGGFFEHPKEDRLGDGRWVYIRDHSIGRGGLATIFTDVTPIKELQAIYEKLADQDALTGLVSRRLFEDRLDHAIAIAKRRDASLSLLYIDLDHFKPVNDSLGHDAGDLVLKEIAKRLLAAARDSDTVARIGGDEFVILMESGSSRAGAEILATRVIDAVGAAIVVDGHRCNVGASIGIATLSAESISKSALIKAADDAMYQAKEAGRGCYRMHDGPDEPLVAPPPDTERSQ